MSSSRLFGTDGIRGRANQGVMTPQVICKVGQALGLLLRQKPPPYERTGPIRVVIGKDTRLSGYMLEQSLASGLNSMGIFVYLVGPLPTPGVGFLVRSMRAQAGVMISASHNPFWDNGVKIFGYDGFKIPEDWEKQIERLVLDEDLTQELVDGAAIGRTRRIDDAQGRYVVFAKSAFPDRLTLDGLRIVLDVAHGAAYQVAPRIFEELGAEVIILNNTPNGLNINDNVGALFPQGLIEAVRQYRADVGVALDGDGDRIVMVDEQGQIVNGDHILGICAYYMKHQGTLKGNTVVLTQMSNFGLEKRLKEWGIEVLKVPVGDRFVVEALRQNDLNLGGEPSGHVVFLDHSTTGDGCIAALKVLEIMRQQQVRLSELNRMIDDYPQVLINVPIRFRKPFEQIQGYSELLGQVQHRLDDEGRVLVRYSGTEPLVRILVEGKDRAVIQEQAQRLAQFLSEQLG